MLMAGCHAIFVATFALIEVLSRFYLGVKTENSKQTLRDSDRLNTLLR